MDLGVARVTTTKPPRSFGFSGSICYFRNTTSTTFLLANHLKSVLSITGSSFGLLLPFPISRDKVAACRHVRK